MKDVDERQILRIMKRIIKYGDRNESKVVMSQSPSLTLFLRRMEPRVDVKNGPIEHVPEV